MEREQAGGVVRLKTDPLAVSASNDSLRRVPDAPGFWRGGAGIAGSSARRCCACWGEKTYFCGLAAYFCSFVSAVNCLRQLPVLSATGLMVPSLATWKTPSGV